MLQPAEGRVSNLNSRSQSVHGQPLRALLYGLAPLLFAPYSPLVLLNVWMPAQRVVAQPLVIMDTGTLNASDQLHYHIHASDRLGSRLNDCWVRRTRTRMHTCMHASIHAYRLASSTSHAHHARRHHQFRPRRS